MAAISASSAPSESVTARALATVAQGRATDDPELARAAVNSLPEDMLSLRADLLVELAELLRSSGNDQGAIDAEEQAARLYERKGNLAAIALLRADSPVVRPEAVDLWRARSTRP